MDEEINVSVSEEVATPQESIEVNQESENIETSESTDVDTESVTEEVAEPHEVEKPVQSSEQNAMYAKIRREAEAKAEARARDSVIAEMGMEWDGKPITNYQQYQQALREQQLLKEAEKQGLDPQFYKDFRNMQDELSYYKRSSAISQQDNELASDPIKGDLYKQWKDDVKQMAEAYNVDLKTAFSVVLDERIGEVLKMNATKIQNETITKINTNQTSPGALSATTEQPSTNAWDMSDDDFAKMMQKATSGELRRF